MEMSENKPVKMSYWIHAIIFVVLSIAIGMLPPFGQITAYGMKILGIFVGLIYGWTFIGFIWPSIFGFILLGYTDYAANVTSAVAAGFSDNLIWQIFFMMIFAEMLRSLKLTEYIGYWLLSRKICVGRPWLLLFMIFAIALVCGGIITLYGTVFMLWAILFDLFTICGYEKRSKICAYAMGGCMYVSAMSCMVFPFRPYPSVVLGLCAKAGATTIPFAAYLVLGLTTAIAIIAIYILVGKFIFKLDLSPIAKMGDVYAEHRNAKMNADTKIGLALLVAFLLLSVISSLLSATIPVVALLKKADMLGFVLIILCIVIVWRKKDGTPLVNFAQLTHAVSWDIIIMLAVTLPICGTMGSEDTGIMATVMAALMPILNGLSPFAFIAVSIILLGLITQVAHNLVLTMTFTPLLSVVAANYGIDPFLFGVLLVTMLQCAVATPAASAQSAMVFANAEWINSKHAYQCGVAFAIIAMFVLVCISYPLGSFLF